MSVNIKLYLHNYIVCMYVQGRVSPCTVTSYVVYCTSLVNFKSAAIPSRRDGTARPTYQRTAEPSPSGGIEDYVGRGNVRNFAQRAPWGMRFFTTRVKRLEVPPGGLVP
jgi:hypothetical protein